MSSTLVHLKGKVAIVTGASAGIGKAIVQALVDRGLQVVGLARRKEKLEEFAKQLKTKNGKLGKFYPFQTDITKEDDILKAFQWIEANLGPVNILVNNAGVTRPKGVTDGDTKLWQEIFDTNVMGLCIATREAVQNMKANNIAGHIIHINSVSGHTIPPFKQGIYPASKWAVTALTEILRQELTTMGSKIKITSISPGLVRTEIVDASGIVFNDQEKQIFDAMPVLNPEDVADAVVYVLSTPPHVQVHELIIKPIGEVA